ncbi:MAG: hypothetical protein LBV12_03460 [Puniceicoccales bacterium]|jgi:hypothetical protein|nr:hypothetical protein [Puniceicoccales bacterium]
MKKARIILFSALSLMSLGVAVSAYDISSNKKLQQAGYVKAGACEYCLSEIGETGCLGAKMKGDCNPISSPTPSPDQPQCIDPKKKKFTEPADKNRGGFDPAIASSSVPDNCPKSWILLTCTGGGKWGPAPTTPGSALSCGSYADTCTLGIPCAISSVE